MARHAFPSPTSSSTPLTDHARRRMSARRISEDDIALVMTFGRVIHTRGAVIHVIGHRETVRLRQRGVNLERCEGLHVVCSPDGAVITVYRNHDLSSLREKGRRCWH